MNNMTEPHPARDRFETLVPSSYEFMNHGFQLANEAEYAQLLQGIEAHKYLTNEKIPFEITMDDALFSWYENVYRPVDLAIERAGLVYAFPEATRAQLGAFDYSASERVCPNRLPIAQLMREAAELLA